MTRMKLPKDRLDVFPPDLMETYLLSHGLVRKTAWSSEEVAGFEYPSQPDAEALVPLWKGFVDYALRIADVLEMIAAVEQRWTWEVFLELENTLKTRTAGRDGNQDSKNGTSNGATSQSSTQTSGVAPKE